MSDNPPSLGSNKAIAGGISVAGSQSLAGALVVVGLWATGASPPAEVAVALQAIVSSLLGIPAVILAVYYTRHGGKEA